MDVPIIVSWPRLLTVKEAASYARQTPRKIRDMVHSGELPIVQFGENAKWRIDRFDLDELISRFKRIA